MYMTPTNNFCECPKCGLRVIPIPETKCSQRACPRCGATMVGMTCTPTCCKFNPNI